MAGRHASSPNALHIPDAYGELPPQWGWLRLDDACEGVFDCPHSTPKLTDQGPLVVRTQDILSGVLRTDLAGRVSEETYRERTARVVPRNGDLLYSREGTYFGIAAEVPLGTRVCLGQRMVLIRPNERLLNSRFLRYWLNSPVLAAHLRGFRDGSVAERLNLPTIRSLPTLVPPLGVQECIAVVLGTLDDKIEQNRRTSEALERLARAIFRAWFVDFEPVKAKVAGAASFPSMPQDVFDALPTEFVDSPIGPIPKGWEAKPLSSAFEVNPTRRISKGTVAPYLEMSEMPTTGHAPNGTVSRAVGSGARFQNGDTLVARITPCLENGKTAYVDFLAHGEFGWGSTEYIVLRPRSPIPPLFAYLLARTREFRAFATQNMTGTSGRQRVPAESLANYDVAVAHDLRLYEAFDALVSPMFDRSTAGIRESRKLAELRDYLLPKLLSGKVRVRDAERLAESPAVPEATL